MIRAAEQQIIEEWARRHAEYERRCHFFVAIGDFAPYALAFFLIMGIITQSGLVWLCFYLLGLIYTVSVYICRRRAKKLALCPRCEKPPFLDDEGRVVADSNPEFCCHCGARLNPPGLAE